MLIVVDMLLLGKVIAMMSCDKPGVLGPGPRVRWASYGQLTMLTVFDCIVAVTDRTPKSLDKNNEFGPRSGTNLDKNHKFWPECPSS